ncbi:MAG: efflux RND transporter permease subunit [Thermoanaerobaculia bacterium]|nr:efflux RND transporter permease subunit [Thermoanaerobaculia bacterium]
MKVIEEAIRSPVKTAVAVLLLSLFGLIAVFQIPVQLTPTVEEPQITVQTFWPGASPAEIEREIVDEQEEQLKGLDGLVKMSSSSQDSTGTINLLFEVGSDKNANLLRVSNRLEQVPVYPSEAQKPIILTSDPNQNALAWMILVPSGETPFADEIWTLHDFVDDHIKPALERVPGVSQSAFFGGREREMQVIVDPANLANHQVALTDLAAAIDRENRNFSGGDFSEGKRRYVVRTIGEYGSPEEIGELVVVIRDGVPIRVRDLAEVRLDYRKPQAKIFYRGDQMMAINVIREPGANILDVMDGVRETVASLNRELLSDNGLKLQLVFDQTDYVHSAIGLVQQSLVIGSILAVIALLLFLRSRTSTFIVAAAIPISVVGTFLVLKLLGRTLNVISLAGLAFAVGMVVDNSIVVLENIYRHRQMGKSRRRAAHDGAVEVWGAVLASTLTTVAVFLPILFVEEEAGQLFRDIALAISSGVSFSLLVAMTVIPSLSAKILDTANEPEANEEDPEEAESRSFQNLWGWSSKVGKIADSIAASVGWICRTTTRRLMVVGSFTLASVLFSVMLMPKAEYLPLGNMNFVFGFALPPPGYNLEEVAKFNEIYEAELSSSWEASGEDAVSLPGGGMEQFFFGVFAQQAFMGAKSRDPLRARELVDQIQQVNQQLQGTIAFVSQASLFSSGFGEGRNIDVEITGPELERLIQLGTQVLISAGQVLPGAQAMPIPGLDLGNPELRVRTDRLRSAELGVSNRDLAFTVDALVDGAKASDYRHHGRELDLVIKSKETFAHRTHLLEQIPVSTPDGQLVTLGSLAEVELVNGPVQIDHRERQRTITIRVTPPDEVPLQQAMERIDSDILQPMRSEGVLGGLYRVTYSGSADKLTKTRRALQWNLLLAIVITYLLMAALFESFLYPFVILFSVPLAALGGFLGLGLLNVFTYQALDVLTMLGFIILIGTVVNNAILIVHQTLNHIRRDGMNPKDAIQESTRTRVRPIFMSVSTSLSGMLPLVLFPGAGSELYRGLGSVVVGGLAVSTVFTLFLVPALLSLVLEAKEALIARRARRRGSDQEPAPAV